MNNSRRIEHPLTGSIRLTAYPLLLLLAVLVSGCRGAARIAAAPAPVAVAACSEGMLAAQAWKCLAAGKAQP